MGYDTEILIDDLVFPECPRWHHGALWFADVHAHRILRVDEAGRAETMVEHRQPAGLGWTPDGALLFVAMLDRTLMGADGRGVRPVADLSALEPCQLNDMVVDSHGNAYIGGFGFDINKGESVRASAVYFVSASGEARVAADEMMFPNGIVITLDGRTLIVAETVAHRLTAFDIAVDGALSARRVWAELDVFPDGICIDRGGAIWIASPVTGECVLVREGGDIVRRIKARANGVYACALGGSDGTTLYLCTANTTGAELAAGRSTGWIERVEDV